MRRSIRLRETPKIGELGRSKSRRRGWLERAPHEQLGGKKRGEIHVEGGARGTHIGGVLALSRVDSRDIRSTQISIGKSLERQVVVVVVGAVGEASVVGVELGELGMDQMSVIRNGRRIRTLHGEPKEGPEKLSLKEAHRAAVLRRVLISRDRTGGGQGRADQMSIPG